MLNFKYPFSILCLFLVLVNSYSDVLKRDIEIVGQIPHGKQSFTQGLIFENGFLYESTGAPENRISKITKIDIRTGEIVKSNNLADIFAEGLTFLDNNFTVLSWKSGLAFKLDKDEFNIKNKLRYKNEGWGLTDDESIYIMSNGSDTLYLRNREFSIVGKVPVRYNGNAVTNLNELEFVNGSVFANVWYSDKIFEINISSGNVISEIDCAKLRAKCQGIDKHDVLNGIAYDAKNQNYYITGKDWPWIFKVKIQ